MARMDRARYVNFARVFGVRVQAAIKEIVAMNYDHQWVQRLRVPYFYKDMLIWFREAIPVAEPVSSDQVRKQCLWHNKAICVGDRPLMSRALSQIYIINYRISVQIFLGCERVSYCDC